MKILFFLIHEYSIPVIRPLVSYLDQEKKYVEYKFFLSSPVEKIMPIEWDPAKLVHSVDEGKQFNPDFVISAENYVDYRLPGLKVQVFHGVGVEKEAHFVIRHFFDIYLTSGPLVSRRFNELAAYYGYFDVVETGWPKFDHILNFEKEDNFTVNDKTDTKVILYAPTFSRKMQSAEILSASIPKQTKENEIWFLKFHELMKPQLKKLFEKLESEKFRIIREKDITPCLHAADIMISDTSSVVYEFLCLGKPVITFRTIGNPDKGINILQPEQLRPTLDLLLNKPDYNLAKSEKILAQINPYLDGKISYRVFEALEQVYKNGLSAKKSKPVNLFRKAKVLMGYY